MAGVLAACAVWLLLQSFVWLEQDRRHQAERAVLQAEAATARARLESELNATLSLSLGLSAFVTAKPDFSQADLARVAASLLRLQPAIRSVALAPDNVIRFVYPHAGNEKALGLRFLETPAQRDAVLRLMREQRPVTAGPIELVQGGVAIVNRIPISTQANGEPKYWGLASVAIDPAPIFERAGIQPASRDGLRYALRGKDGLGAQGEVFLGNAALFGDPGAVLMDVIIPGGSWQLAARTLTPAAGYGLWVQGLLAALAVATGLLVAADPQHGPARSPDRPGESPPVQPAGTGHVRAGQAQPAAPYPAQYRYRRLQVHQRHPWAQRRRCRPDPGREHAEELLP
jgi:sensor domain CHASE-containing protein